MSNDYQPEWIAELKDKNDTKMVTNFEIIDGEGLHDYLRISFEDGSEFRVYCSYIYSDECEFVKP